MRYIFVFLIICHFNLAFSQTCLPGSVFMSQSDIDNFSTNYPGCTEVLGDLYINSDVTSVQGLSQLTKVNGWLDIYQNNMMTNLNGFENIDTIGNLFLQGNALNDLSGLSNVKYCDGWFILRYLDEVESLPFNNLTYIGEELQIIELENLTTIDQFDNLSYVKTGINIQGSFFGSDVLASITTFGLLDTIDNLQILLCDVLTDVSGFSNVKKINRACSFGFLDQFQDFSAFDNLETTGTISISSCPLVDSIIHFQSVDSITGGLLIGENPNLFSLGTFDSLVYVGQISIFNNPKLTDIRGLTSVTAMGDELNIEGNAILEDLTGLVNIDGSTIITDNIDGIDIVIKNNPALSNCSVKSICEAFESSTIGYDISNNKEGCNTSMEIIENCCPDSLVIDWTPVLTGTYKSAGDIYYNTNILSANQNIILSHGPDSTAYLPSSLIIEENATLEIQNTGCN